MKLISILVPCCNVEQYVRECLESIKNQTYKDIEVICIDDGSKDNTGAIIDEFVASDSRFKVIHKPNSGYGDSMNKGLDMAKGDYIGIIESDDWIEPDMFETLLNTAEENNLDLTRCCWYEGPTGCEDANTADWVKKNIVYCPLDEPDTFYQQPAIWVNLYKRELLKEGRQIRFLPTPGASYQDTSFAFKVYTKAKRFMMLDKCLHHYRINPNSSVSSSGKVFCLNDEWEEMVSWIKGDEHLKNFFSSNSVLANIVYGGFDWNYHRLTPYYALRFLHRTSNFLKEIYSSGIFNISASLSKTRKNVFENVIDKPLMYHEREVYGVLEKYSNAVVDMTLQNQSRLISVVVPCYNTAKYILQSLRSICEQSYRNIEIICVDDCSTDETEMLVRHAMKKDKRISFLKTEKNSGLSVSRNLGIKNCRGDYVLFVDGDDYLLPGAISSMVEAMTENVDVVVAGIKVYYDGGEDSYGDLVESDKHYYRIKKSEMFDAIRNIDKSITLNVSACAKLWNLSVIKNKVLCFAEGLLYEDANFYWKYLSVASNVKTLSKDVYLYQRHQVGSIMSSTFQKKSGMAIQHLYILDDLSSFFKAKNNVETGKQILQKVYEPYFWFAYNNSPEEDYDKVVTTALRIVEENDLDTSKSNVFKHLANYDKVSKAKMFMDIFMTGNVIFGNDYKKVDGGTEVLRLNKKLKRYRRNIRKLIWLSSVFLLMIIALLVYIICLY